MGTPDVIGIHAERVAGDGRVVRWVVPAGTVAAGRVRSAPGRLGEMLSAGTFSDALTEHTAVWLWLGEGLSWATLGRPVQAALREALADPDGWVVEPAPGEVLEHVTARRSGGDAVAVQLGGACEHCPAAGYTLRARLLGELRRRCPDLVEVDGEPGGLTLTLAG